MGVDLDRHWTALLLFFHTSRGLESGLLSLTSSFAGPPPPPPKAPQPVFLGRFEKNVPHLSPNLPVFFGGGGGGEGGGDKNKGGPKTTKCRQSPRIVLFFA